MNKLGNPPVPPIGLTARYPEIGAGLVNTAIYHDPAIFAKEMEAIFKRSWYMIGRVEQIPDPGDFFTCELPGFRLAVLVCRDRDGKVNAFHNVCTHRGNVAEHRAAEHCNG